MNLHQIEMETTTDNLTLNVSSKNKNFEYF